VFLQPVVTQTPAFLFQKRLFAMVSFALKYAQKEQWIAELVRASA
jgi:hypothetical protein